MENKRANDALLSEQANPNSGGCSRTRYARPPPANVVLPALPLARNHYRTMLARVGMRKVLVPSMTRCGKNASLVVLPSMRRP